MKQVGRITWINGPVLWARITGEMQMMEQVEVSDYHLVGEVISMEGEIATLQVYEETAGLKPGDPVYGVGMPLSVELGPGLIGGIFDGIQRPLDALAAQSGSFIERGVTAPSLDRDREWTFEPSLEEGQRIDEGTIIGTIQETPLVEHRIMVPIGATGQLTWIASAGNYRVTDTVARIDTDQGESEITLVQRWPVRKARPTAQRLAPTEPLVTGQRVIDTLFPLAKGGTAAVPGGFGTGKTVLQQALAKWSDADLVIYVGCGERGNEMTDVLREFPKIVDPQTGHSLIERTILIANTSNMPVAAREASIYTGITLAEYYRDMGYNVALMADSTSRWAEALREISGRLEEMPAEEGFPAYLPSRLASFYERAGRVKTIGERRGSVTVVGAVSPPSGDFSEPVTQHTQRFVRVFWALDKSLAEARHFPAVSWLESYSGYVEEVANWWEEDTSQDWEAARARIMQILQQESHLQEIVKLVGPDALPDLQQFTLFIARMIKEAFLQQNAMDEIDAYATPQKQMAILQLLLHIRDEGARVINMGAPVGRLRDEIDVWQRITRAKANVPNDALDELDELRDTIDSQLQEIAKDYAS